MKILICTIYKLDIKKNPQEEAKLANFVIFFNVEKNQAVDIVTPKDKEISKLKILMMVTKIFFFG